MRQSRKERVKLSEGGGIEGEMVAVDGKLLVNDGKIWPAQPMIHGVSTGGARGPQGAARCGWARAEATEGGGATCLAGRRQWRLAEALMGEEQEGMGSNRFEGGGGAVPTRWPSGQEATVTWRLYRARDAPMRG